MTTRLEQGYGEDPESGTDDPFLVILRPSPGYLAAPPGHYEKIRRTASRRRLARAAAGAALALAAAGLLALPFRHPAPEGPAAPTVPMAPPAVTTPPPADRTATRAPDDQSPAVPVPSRPPASREVPRPEESAVPTTGAAADDGGA